MDILEIALTISKRNQINSKFILGRIIKEKNNKKNYYNNNNRTGLLLVGPLMMQVFIINLNTYMNREVYKKWFCTNVFKQCYQLQTKNAIGAVLFFFTDFLLTTGKTGLKVTHSNSLKEWKTCRASLSCKGVLTCDPDMMVVLK